MGFFFGSIFRVFQFLFLKNKIWHFFDPSSVQKLKKKQKKPSVSPSTLVWTCAAACSTKKLQCSSLINWCHFQGFSKKKYSVRKCACACACVCLNGLFCVCSVASTVIFNRRNGQNKKARISGAPHLLHATSVTCCSLDAMLWRDIFVQRTRAKNRFHVTSVVHGSETGVACGTIWTRTLEKNRINVRGVTGSSLGAIVWPDTFETRVKKKENKRQDLKIYFFFFFGLPPK